MEHFKAAKKRWAKCLLLACVAISPQAFSVNYITSLTGDSNVVYFTTQEDKTHAVPGCVSAANQQKWSVSSDASTGLYDLLYIAQSSNQPVEVESANDCALESSTERASTVKVNYEYSDTQAATIASNLNFVARSTVTMAEGGVLDSVIFTLTNSAGTPNLQTATEENGYYLHDFGVLAAGNYTLTTKAASGDEVNEETIPFSVTNVAMEDAPVVYQTNENNLYVQLPSRLGGKYIKISKEAGAWVVEEITLSEWENLNLSESGYSIEFGEFSGDSDEDIRLVSSDELSEIIIEQKSEGYSVITNSQTNIDKVPKEGGFSTYVPSSQEVIGEIKGIPSVNGGAFSYQVPISIAPGRRGMQPSISLNYSSQSGRGIAGYGWSLSASESISRCGEIFDLDQSTFTPTLSDDDKLCLNGSRLIIQEGLYGDSGTTYTTERNPNVLVTQSGDINGTATSFTVTYLSGHTAKFGTSDESRKILSGHIETMSWLLESKEDSVGNQIHYVYDTNVIGNRYIQNIYYTGSGGTHGSRQVTFNYTPIDEETSYQWGGKSVHNNKLSSIDVSINSTKQATWVLGYQAADANKLASLSYCDASESDCIKSDFAWLTKTDAYLDEGFDNSLQTTLVADVAEQDRKMYYGGRIKKEADFDGDGVLYPMKDMYIYQLVERR